MDNLFFELDFNANNAEQKIAILKGEIDRLATSFKTANNNSLKLQESQNRLNQLSEKYPETASLIVDSVHNISSEITILQDKQRKLNLTIDSEVKMFFELDAEIKKAENSLKLFGNANEVTNLKAKKLSNTITELEKELSQVNTDTEDGQDKFLALSEQIDIATKSYKSFTDRTTIAQNAVKRLTNEINQLEQAQKRVGKTSSQGQLIETKLQQRRASLQTAQNVAGQQNNTPNIPQLGNSQGILQQIQGLIGGNNTGFTGLQNIAGGASGRIGTFLGGLSRFTVVTGAIAAVGALANKVGELALELAQGAKEFETLRTTLNTSLGNIYRTGEAMERIKKFAAETPYEVKQLTDVFARLAGVNLQPTNEQLKAMGDFASSKGIPIEQLTEAILDVSDVERWRNLGVQISNSGAKMTATFNGQTITIDRTVKGAMKMVETFGNVAGVQGAMIEQSKTLAGMESNLADSEAALSNTIGEIAMPVAKSYINIKKQLTDTTQSLLAATKEYIDYQTGEMFNENTLLSAKINKENLEVEKTRLAILQQKIKELALESGYNEKTKQFSKQDFFTFTGGKEIDPVTKTVKGSGAMVSIQEYFLQLKEQEKIIQQDIGFKMKEYNTYLSNRNIMMKSLGQMQVAGYELTQKELNLIANYVDKMPAGVAKEFQDFFIKTRENIIDLQQSIVGILPEGLRRLRAELPAELQSISNQFDAKRNEMINQAMQAGLISPDDMIKGIISPANNDKTTQMAVAALKEQLAIIDKTEANKRSEQIIKNSLERERIIREYQYYVKELNQNSLQAEIDLQKSLGALSNDRIITKQMELDLTKLQLEKEKELFDARQKAKEKATSKGNEAELFAASELEINAKFIAKEADTRKKAALETQNYLNDLAAKDRDLRIAIREDQIKGIQDVLDTETQSLETRIDLLQKIRDIELLILEDRKKQIIEESKTITDPNQRAAKLLELKKIDLEIAQKNKQNVSTGIGTTTNLGDRISSIDTELAKTQRATGIKEQEAQLEMQTKLKDFWRFNDLRAERAYQNQLWEIRKEALKNDIELAKQKVKTTQELYGKDSKQAQEAQSQLNAKNIELGQIEVDRTRQQREDWSNVISQSYDIGKQAARDYFTSVIQGYDNDIRKQENRVERAARIAERGNAELLEREQERLDKLKEERENYVKAQQVLDLIEFGSKSAVAIANAAASGWPLNLVAIPLTIATLVAGIAQINAIKGNVSAFAEGTDSVKEGNNSSMVLDVFKPKDRNDKVLSLLSPNEAVIQADIAKNNPKTVKALRRGLLTDSHLEGMNSYNYLPYQVPYIVNMQSQETNGILREMSDKIANMQNQISLVTHQVNITKEGLYKVTKDEESRVKRIHNKR